MDGQTQRVSDPFLVAFDILPKANTLPAFGLAFLFMPTTPKRPCAAHGCGVLVERGRCAAHQSQQRQAHDSTRGNSAERGYDNKWRKARQGYLRSHPLCVECERQGRVTAADVVDHITPHRGDMTLFWNSNNWQSLCTTCHNIKTATEDGGFGNKNKGRGVG